MRLSILILPLLASAAAASAQSTCEARPANGARLGGPLQLKAEGHAMEFVAGRDGDAIVKVREADRGVLVAAWYIRAGQRAEVIGIPDGDYVVQYAVGQDVTPDCRTFATVRRSGQVPGEDILKSAVADENEDARLIRGVKVTYSFFRRIGNNLTARPISPSDFGAE